MEREEQSELLIYSMKAAGYMMMHGCPLLNIGFNEKDRKYRVFFFKDTEKARRVKDEWFTSQR